RAGFAVRVAASFHGHVARFRSGDRRGRNVYPRRHRLVRKAQEAMIVGFDSPLPPSRTCVADYAGALLAALRRRGNVEVNPAHARIVREHAPDAHVVEIPHLFAPPVPISAAEVLSFRQALHLSAHHFVFGVFGYLRESKRIMNILRSFDAIHRALPYTALLLAGEFVSSDLERAVEPFLRRSGILRMGHLPERDFWIAAGAVDACINVRYPAAGE